jgi:hypothetical protein
MIPPLPPNFGFSLLAVPVWRWEDAPAVPPADGACAAPDGSAATASGAPSAPSDKRLVFLGYQWRAAPEWYLFPDAPWEHSFEDQVADIRDGASRRGRESQEDRQAAAAAAKLRAAAQGHDAPSRPGDADHPSAPPTDAVE